ncbi:MAG: hypothetical protein WCA35_19895 [Kovacikia sp.]
MSESSKPVFFVDECCLGIQVVEVLRSAGASVEIHSDHFPSGKPDVEWLAEVSQKGWLVITKDNKISRNTSEQMSIAIANAKVFIWATGSASRNKLVRDLEGSVVAMERFAISQPSPFIAKVYPYGKVQLWKHRDKLLKVLRQNIGIDEGT